MPVDRSALNALQLPVRRTGDATIDKNTADIRVALSSLISAASDVAVSPAAYGKFVTAKLSTSTVQVGHDLGREWKGFLVCNIDADARVWSDPGSNSKPKTTIPLTASAPCSVTLWVF